MDKIISILFAIVLILTAFYLFKLNRGEKPFVNNVKVEVKGLYEACRISGGMTKVDRDVLGRRLVICTIPLE
jgi:hypothetical protein